MSYDPELMEPPVCPYCCHYQHIHNTEGRCTGTHPSPLLAVLGDLCPCARGTHEPTDDCEQWHCYSHDQDERSDVDPVYIICFECRHLYRTARELRRAWRRGYPWGRWWKHPFGVKGFEPSIFASVWAYLTVRASRIRFCPTCMHDF